MAKQTEEDTRGVLYQVVKFKIRPNSDQLHTLQLISDNLWQVRDEALRERIQLFHTYHAPFYDALKKATDEAEKLRLRAELKQAFKDHAITHFDQCKTLTPKRAANSAFAAVPCAWQQETLKTLAGGFSSSIALRTNGDRTARVPGPQQPEDFTEIEGLLSFQIQVGKYKVAAQMPLSDTLRSLLHNGQLAQIVLSPGKSLPGGATLSFPFASYAGVQLGNARRVKKFTLYRTPTDIRVPGTFWISIAYEIERPVQVPFGASSAVYVALGDTAIGVVSPKGEEVIDLWRPDKHWMPKIEALKASLTKEALGTNIHALTPGSKQFRKLEAKKVRMYRLMSEQQKHDRRNIVARALVEPIVDTGLLDAVARKLERHGVHFVVSDIIIRGKEGKLADATKTERGGVLGRNWSVQNTGTIARLVQQLEQKAAEAGGSVRKFRATSPVPPGMGCERKILMARRLRDDFLKSL